MSEDKDKAPERIWRTTNGYIYKGPTPEPCVEYIRADLVATKVREAGEEAFKAAAGIATMMAAGETFETGRQKALNIAAALERASGEGENDG